MLANAKQDQSSLFREALAADPKRQAVLKRYEPELRSHPTRTPLSHVTRTLLPLWWQVRARAALLVPGGHAADSGHGQAQQALPDDGGLYDLS